VTGTLSGLGQELEGIRQLIGEAVARSADEGKKPKGDIELVLERIDALVKTTSQPRIDVRVERDAAIAEFLGQHLAVLDRTMVPLAQSAAASASRSSLVEARLGDLSAELRTLGEKLSRGVVAIAGPPKFDAPLDERSLSNFYLLRGAPKRDVLEHGGIFVATFRPLPEKGTRIDIRLILGEGTTFDVVGEMQWGRVSRGIEDRADAPPGFGARIVELPEGAREAIASYMASRAPFLHQDEYD